MPSNSSPSPWHALRDRLHGLRVRVRWVAGLEGCFTAGTLVCSLALLLSFLESFLYFESAYRLTLVSACVVCLLAVVCWRWLRFFSGGTADDNLARQVDRQYPGLHDGVTVALQLSRQRDAGSNASPALLDAAISDAVERTQSVDFNEADQRRRVVRSACGFGVVVLLVLVALAAYGEPLFGAFNRLTHPLTHFQPPQRTFLRVLPGDAEVTSGGQVTIVAEVTGELAERTVLRLVADGGAQQSIDMRATAPGSYIHTLREVTEPLTYEIEAGDAVSPPFRIRTIHRPFLGSLQLTYHYPAYTGLEPRTAIEGGDIVALRGTRVDLVAVDANRNLRDATLYLEDANEDIDRPVALTVSDQQAMGSLVVKTDQRYRITLRNADGHENEDPAWYRIIALPDRIPSVRVLSPGRDVDLTENMVVSLLVSGTDDFGFSKMDLVYRKEPGGEEQRKAVPVDRESTVLLQPFLWNLSNENLFPEDVVSYRIELFDNDTISGPKKAVSRIYTLRFPSLEEIYNEIDGAQAQQVSDMEDLLEAQEESQKKIEALNRTLEQHAREGTDGQQVQELTWEQKKEIESVLTGQEEATDELLSAAEAVKAAAGKLEDHDSPSQELINSMDQLRKLFQEIATPELLEAMRELKTALRSFDGEQLKKSMEAFEFEQEEFLRRLERSLVMLKRIRAEQLLTAAVRQTSELAVRQDELRHAAEYMSDGKTGEELANKQQQLGEDTEALRNDLENLASAMDPFQDMPAERVRASSAEMDRQELKGNMDRISGQLKVGRIQQALEGQQTMSRALSKLNQQLEDIQDQLQEDAMREITGEMRRAIHRLVELSMSQEILNGRTRNPGGADTRIALLAEDQKGLLNGASLVANDIVSITQKTLFISPSIGRALGETLNSMQHAEDQLADRSRDPASEAQQVAMESLNETVLALQRAMRNMANSGSSSGMMDLIERLRGMARQQTGINDQMNQMMQAAERMTLEKQAQISRLAARQDALRKDLEQLRREQLDHQGQILGRLQEIEREMEETVRTLQQYRVDPGLLRRQQRILSRLLDASRSIRGREREERRRAAPGEDVANRPSPDDLSDGLTRRERTLRNDILRGIEEDAYPREYAELIRAYFRALSNIPVVH